MRRPCRIIIGPWEGPAPRLEGRSFEQLSDDQQRDMLHYALYDLRRYWSDLTPNERHWILRHLPAGSEVLFEALSSAERARLAGAALLVLRQRAGWAA